MAEDNQEGSGGRPEFVMAYLGPAGAAPAPDDWVQGIGDLSALDVAPAGYWAPIGPAAEQVDADQIYMGTGPVAGEVTDISIDPNVAGDKTIYISTNNGGIWKTTDGGNSWRQMMDSMPSLSMSSVAIDPGNSNVIYATTGNLFDGGHAFSEDAGLYKSIDGGETWFIADGGLYGTVLAGSGNGIYKIICPEANSVLVSTLQGLFRSVDGGINFGANAPDFNDGKPIYNGDITSVILDAQTPTQKVWFADNGNGIFALTIKPDKSVSISANLFASSHLTNYNDISLAQATQAIGKDPNPALYASVQYQKPPKTAGGSPTPTYVGLYKTVDLGTSWKVVAAAKARGNDAGKDQSNYDRTVAVDPQDPKRIYIGFQQLWVSADGGVTFPAPAVSSSQIHYDHHAFVFSPPANQAASAPSTFYVGEDGGFAKGEAAVPGKAKLKLTNLNSGVATSLLGGIDIGRGSAGNNAYTYSGMQDTGTAQHRPAYGAKEWHAGINGDGGRVAVDPVDPQIAYGFDDESFMKTSNAGAKWTLSDSGSVGTGLKNKAALKRLAIERKGLDKTKRTVYVSEDQVLNVSTNAGVSFKAIKPTSWTSQITAIEIDASDSTRIWVGCVDGSVHLTTDSGKTWDAGSFTPTPGAAVPVGDIAVDPANGSRVAVAYLGLNGITGKIRTQHCYLSTDGGNSWNDISGTDGSGPKGNLPDLPLRSVVFDKSTTPSTILASTDGGVLTCADAGKPWQVYGVGLPMASCRELCIDNTTGLLRVSTYGRSAFEFTKQTGGFLVVVANLAFDPAAVGQVRTLPIQFYNCGDADVNISAINPTAANPHFALDSTLPIVVKAHQPATAKLEFQPQGGAPALVTGEFQIVSDAANSLLNGADAVASGSVTMKVSGQAFATPQGSRLAVNANLGFGEVNTGDTQTLTFQVSNTGTKDLVIKDIQRINGSGDFNINPAPTPNLVVLAGASETYTVEFKPSSVGPLTAEFQIDTDASRASAIIAAQGTGASHMATWLKVVLIVGGVVLVAGAVGGIAYYESQQHNK